MASTGSCFACIRDRFDCDSDRCGTLSCLGLALGIGGLFLAGRGLRGLLVGVSPTDPVTISLVAAGLGIVAVVAGWSPAWHASRVDPIQALRSK